MVEKNTKLYGVGLAALLTWLALSALLVCAMSPAFSGLISFVGPESFPFVTGLMATVAVTFVNMGIAVFYGALEFLNKQFKIDALPALSKSEAKENATSFLKVVGLSIWSALTAFSSLAVLLMAGSSFTYAFIALGAIGISCASIFYTAREGHVSANSSHVFVESEKNITQGKSSTLKISKQLDVSPSNVLAIDSTPAQTQINLSNETNVRNVQVQAEENHPSARRRIA